MASFIDLLSLSIKNSILKHFKLIFPLAHFFAAAVLSLLLYYIYIQTLAVIKEQFNNQQLLVAKQTAVGIEKTINSAVSVLSELTQEPSLQITTAQENRKIIRDKLNYVKDLNINDAGLLDGKGIIIISLSAPHFEGAYFLYRDYFQKIRAQKSNAPLLEFINLKQGEKEQKAIVAMMPVLYPQGDFCCAVYFNLLIEDLLKDFVALDSTEREFRLLDAEGTILYDTLSADETFNNWLHISDPAFRRFIEDVKVRKIAKGEYRSPRGAKTIAASYPLRVGNLTLSVMISTNEEVLSTLLKSSSVRFTLAAVLVFLLVASTSFIIIFLVNRWSLELDSMVKARTREIKHYADKLEEARNELERKVEERSAELSKTHEALVRKEKLALLGELAGSVSHELRNPLGVIKNAIYFFKMRMNTYQDEDIKENIRLIEKEIETANKIISDLLDFARDKTPIRLDVNLNQLVKDMLSRSRIPETIAVQTDLTDPMASVSIDPTQVAQVFFNLIENAVQAMDRGGTLTVSTRRKNNIIDVIFADNGYGIPQENLRQIFDPLFTTKTKGIGLGLAISKSLIESNGGTIMVESDGKSGSTFTVRLSAKE